MKNKWNTLRLSWFSSCSVYPSVIPGDLFWAGVLSCVTSITGCKMNEVGLVSVLCLLFAKAAGALKHREHLQTQSNEAAGHTASPPPCTNQSCWPLREPKAEALRAVASYGNAKIHGFFFYRYASVRESHVWFSFIWWLQYFPVFGLWVFVRASAH